MMDIGWNHEARTTFDVALAAHLASQFPDTALAWIEDHKRLIVRFPDGCTCTIFEPNFFFLRGPMFTDDELFARAAQAVKGQYVAMRSGEVI